MKRTALIGMVHKLYIVCLLLFAVPVIAAANEPLKMVQETADSMLAAIKADRAEIDKDNKRLYPLVEKIVLPHFDFDRMAKMVLGKYWRRASDEQRRHFVEEFRFLLVRTYATAMLEYTDQDITYLPYRPGPDADEGTVQTEVEQASGFPVPIDYKLFRDNGEWKVYEVVIDGVGLVINYRSSFGTEIRGKEGLDGLIKKLKDRNDEARNE